MGTSIFSLTKPTMLSAWILALNSPLSSWVNSWLMDNGVEMIYLEPINSCGRNTAFGKLGSWPVELVVERSLASSTMPLSPSNALLRVFEVMTILSSLHKYHHQYYRVFFFNLKVSRLHICM